MNKEIFSEAEFRACLAKIMTGSLEDARNAAKTIRAYHYKRLRNRERLAKRHAEPPTPSPA
jgi:hypothetical protein